MGIDLLREKLIYLGRAARRIPRCRLGRPVSPNTLLRWHCRGVLVGDRRVYLEAVRLPSGTATTLEALARFITALQEYSGSRSIQTSSGREKLTDVIRSLDQDGI